MAAGMCASPSALMAVSMMDSHLALCENPQAQVGGESISQASTGQTAASLTKALCHSWASFTFLLGDTSGISFLVFKFIVSALAWLCALGNSACCSSSDVRKRFFIDFSGNWVRSALTTFERLMQRAQSR